jgi:hypothetical protein
MLGPGDQMFVRPEDVLPLAAAEKLKFVDKDASGEYHYSLVFEKI